MKTISSTTQLPTIIRAKNQSNGEIKVALTKNSVMVAAPDNAVNRTVLTSLTATAIFTGAAIKSKNPVVSVLFAFAAIGCAGHAIDTAYRG